MFRLEGLYYEYICYYYMVSCVKISVYWVAHKNGTSYSNWNSREHIGVVEMFCSQSATNKSFRYFFSLNSYFSLIGAARSETG